MTETSQRQEIRTLEVTEAELAEFSQLVHDELVEHDLGTPAIKEDVADALECIHAMGRIAKRHIPNPSTKDSTL